MLTMGVYNMNYRNVMLLLNGMRNSEVAFMYFTDGDVVCFNNNWTIKNQQGDLLMKNADGRTYLISFEDITHILIKKVKV